MACSSNCNWTAPRHKKPPLSWCIVFQRITHCRSGSFCWGCSCSMRRGGLEVTESAELLFRAFIVFTWSPIGNPAAWRKALSLWQILRGHIKSRAEIYDSSLRDLTSPQERIIFKITKLWSLSRIDTVCSDKLRTSRRGHWFPIGAGLTTVAPHTPLSNCLYSCCLINIAICLFKLA